MSEIESPSKKLDRTASARERFKRCAEHEDKQRKQILACKNFRAGNQWPDEIRIQRQGVPAIQGQAAQPPRPMLTIDRISQPTRQVSNGVKSANFAMNVQPNGYGSDDDTADIFKGILRWIQNRARAEAPVDWAADGAAEGGIGWFRVYAEYAVNEWPDTDEPLGPEYGDQDLCLGRITNNLTVYCDPSAKKPTRSDARFMFVTEDVAKEEFKRLWPTANVTALDEFRSTGDNNGWVTEDSIRVAEYWSMSYEAHELVEVVGPEVGQSLWMRKEAVPADTPKELILSKRKLFKPVVTCQKITATEVLEEWEWLGRRIPLFPVLGEELNVDGESVLRGVIGPAMDAQRMVNYMYSAAIETVALAPKAPLIVAEGQVERYKNLWQNANRFNYSYLPYTPVSLLGSPVPPPQRDQAEAPIQAMVVMLEKSEDGVKATTATYDPALGQSAKDESGKKVLALQKQTEQTNSNYIDNVITTLTECGDELVYLIPRYYQRAGRIQQILGIDDKPTQVMLGQPYQPSPQGPQPVQMDPAQVKAEKGMAKFHDLSAGRYAVTVVVGKSYSTKRDEGALVLGEMISQNPQLLQIFGDLFFRDLDIPGSQEIAERMKKMLAPNLQEQDGQEPNPQQMQAKLQQLGQMVEFMTKELEAKTKYIETEQVKAERDFKIKQLEESSESQRTVAKLTTEERLERLKLVADILKTRATLEVKQTEAMIDREIQQLDTQVAAAGDQAERESATNEADKDRQLSVSEADKDRSISTSEAERGRAHELTLAERQEIGENASGS